MSVIDIICYYYQYRSSAFQILSDLFEFLINEPYITDTSKIIHLNTVLATEITTKMSKLDKDNEIESIIFRYAPFSSCEFYQIIKFSLSAIHLAYAHPPPGRASSRNRH